jgi:hypothetical protein
MLMILRQRERTMFQAAENPKKAEHKRRSGERVITILTLCASHHP